MNSNSFPNEMMTDSYMSLINDIESDIYLFNEESMPETLQSVEDILWAIRNDIESLPPLFQQLKLAMQEFSSLKHESGCNPFLYNPISYEGREVVLERDDRGNIHSGECVVSYNYCADLVGRRVVLNSIQPNINIKTREYKYYAQFVRTVD